MPKSYPRRSGIRAARGTAASGARVQAGPGDRSQQKASGLWAETCCAAASRRTAGPSRVRFTSTGACSSWVWPPVGRVSGTPTVSVQLLSRIETDDPDRASPAGAGTPVEFQRAAKAAPAWGVGTAHGREDGLRPAPRRPQRRSASPRHCHTIASNVSLYLSSELAANPSEGAGETGAGPSCLPAHDLRRGEMLAFLPPSSGSGPASIERLAITFSSPHADARSSSLRAKSSLKPIFEAPRRPAACGPPRPYHRIPFALYWIEAHGSTRPRAPDSERQPGAGPPSTSATTKGSGAEEACAPCPRRRSPLTAALLPARGTRKRARHNGNGRHVPLGLIARLMGIPVEIV